MREFVAASRRPALIGLACIAVAFPARADGLNAGDTDKLGLNVPADAVVIALGAAGTLVPEIFKSQLAPDSCHWCGSNGVDRAFHDFFEGALVSRKTANTISNVTAFVLAPALAFGGVWIDSGPHATSGAALRSAVIVAEGTLVALALSQSVKLAAGRARPFVYYNHPSQPGEGSLYDLSSKDANLSFPSGHSTIAAALGVGSAMTATLEESPAAPWLWAGAGVLTASTGIFRLIAEKHWFTDDVAGIAIGGGCGVLFPLLHRRGSLLGGGKPVIPIVASVPGGGTTLGLAGRF